VAEVQRRLPKKVKRRRPAAGDTEVRPVAEIAIRYGLFWDGETQSQAFADIARVVC
jgi:hypothetical protein